MTALLSSNESTPVDGIALVCATDGEVREVVVSSLEGAPIGRSLPLSVELSSGSACELFVRSLERGGFARSTPLRIGTRDVQCFGLCKDDELTVVGVIDPLMAAPFAESVAASRNGDVRFARLAEEIRRTHSTYQLYEELARVNNELVTAQRELARTVGELERLNAFKDELLGMAAHDLRNPLHANAAYITFLLDDPEAFGHDHLKLLQRLRSNSEYMLRLVESVLDFSAIQSGHVRLQKEQCSIITLVEGVVETMRIIAEPQKIAVRLDAPADLPPMELDAVKIAQAVQNLVSNAVQYSPPDSAVDVRIHANGAFVDIDVEDRGPGIPPDELPNLFKAFTRLSTSRVSRQRSVGLGLAITRRMVEAHGGTVDVRSEVGKGSTFLIRLPM